LVKRSDQLVRDVVSVLSARAIPLDDATITAFRVCAGIALREAAMYARQYQLNLDQRARSEALRHRLPKVMVRGQPAATTRDDPDYDSETTTLPMGR
jgi:hypothetical protein